MLTEEKAFEVHKRFFPDARQLTKRVYEAYKAIYELGMDAGTDLALEVDDDDSWDDLEGPDYDGSFS